MSIQAMDWAWDQDTGGAGAQVVLVALCSFADESGICWPSQATLSRMTKVPPRSVRHHLAQLEHRGLIAREERHKANGTRTTDRYWLLAPAEALKQGAKPEATIATSPAAA